MMPGAEKNLSKFFCKILENFWGIRVVEAVEDSKVAEADEVNEAAEVLSPEKSLLKIIQTFEFSFILMLWNKIYSSIESLNVMLNFSTFPVNGCRL